MSASPPARSQQPASCPCPGFTPHAVPAPSAWVWTRGAPGLSRALTQVLVARGTVAVSGACEEMAWSLPGDGSGRPSCHHVEKGLGAAPAAARGSGCSCEKGAALMTLGHPCQQAASLRAWDEGPPPRVFPGVCPGRGGGLVRLCPGPQPVAVALGKLALLRAPQLWSARSAGGHPGAHESTLRRTFSRSTLAG